VDTNDGITIAQNYNVMSVPTVIFFDSLGKETGRAKNTLEVKTAIEEKLTIAV
jgi:thioredoxin-related protein